MRLPTFLIPALLLLLLVPALAQQEVDPVLWPERQRAFLQDGPGLLLPQERLDELLSLSEEARDAFIRDFLERDPLPETPENELEEGISRRQWLVRHHGLSPVDIRAKLLFLHGEPLEVVPVECGHTFKPMEIWRYPEGEGVRGLVLYRPGATLPFRLWMPLDSKRSLYTEEMDYYLQQYYELGAPGRRFDLQTCPETRQVDAATGVDGLFEIRPDQPSNREIRDFVAAPDSLAAWARRAAAEPLPSRPPELPVERFRVLFPDEQGQRIVTRFLVVLREDVRLEARPVEEGDDEVRIQLLLEGIIEQDGRVFDEFRVRYRLSEPAPGTPIALAMQAPLRPRRSFVVRLELTDEVGGGTAFLSRGFAVPPVPEKVEEPEVPEEAMMALGQSLSEQRIAGQDSLLLVPPPSDVVLGLYRAEALVTGASIQKVVFSVDDQPQLTRTRPPYTAEVRLSTVPRPQVIRAAGFDAVGELVASDEVVVNQPRGSFQVRILSPPRGVSTTAGESIRASAEVVVPEERTVEQVEFLLNDEVVRSLEQPPWELGLEAPAGGEVSYLTVVATLDDGSRAEDVRFLNSPQYLEEVNVQLVELYTTVTDRSGRLIRGLTEEDFQVYEDGRPQEITKFELVEDLPLHLGITIDTSGSMVSALPVAREAAVDFLQNIITPKDRVFAVSFSDKPILLVPPTNDVGAVAGALEGLQSLGWTTLHDAVVTSLYYFRAVRGRKALILLSDGDDTASSIPYRETLEFARRSGVVIFTVGLDVGRIALGVRKKLNQLAEETGGRSFYIQGPTELRSVYSEIEAELRSQYLLAYPSDRPERDGSFREVEVEVSRGKARTRAGYYS